MFCLLFSACQNDEATCYWDGTQTVSLKSPCMHKDTTTGRGVATGDDKCYGMYDFYMYMYYGTLHILVHNVDCYDY